MNIVLTCIILVFGLAGIHKGLIRSLGGLLSIILSYILSKLLSGSAASIVIRNTNLTVKLTDAIESAATAWMQFCPQPSVIANSTYVSGVQDAIIQLSDDLVIRIITVMSGILLFSIFMFTCGIGIHMLNKVFEALPVGKTLNRVGGLICGVIKGATIMAVIYYFGTAAKMR